jgi:hypothetical protein
VIETEQSAEPFATNDANGPDRVLLFTVWEIVVFQSRRIGRVLLAVRGRLWAMAVRDVATGLTASPFQRDHRSPVDLGAKRADLCADRR